MVKFIEAIFSLVVLTLLCMTVLNIAITPKTPRIYREQLAQDVWRIVQLKYENLPATGSSDWIKLNADLVKIKSMTGLCVYIKGVQISNCRGSSGVDIVTIHRYYVDYTPLPWVKDVAITLKREQ